MLPVFLLMNRMANRRKYVRKTIKSVKPEKKVLDADYCRTCMSTENLVAIFHNKECEKKRSEDLRLVTGLEIKVNDGLPQKICDKCIEVVHVALQFRRTSRKSEKTLLNKYFGKSKKKFTAKASKSINKCPKEETEKEEIDFSYEDVFENDFQNELDFSYSNDDVTPKKEPEINISTEKRKREIIPNATSYKCTICSKDFRMKATYKAHMRFHTNYCVCESCGKRCRNNNQLQEHKRARHGLGRIHKCAYCEYSSATKEALTIHERRHTGERPYRCAHCPRAFADKGACTAHTRTHSRDTSYACLYCGQTFVQKSKLTYHIRKHTGENLESCTVCSKLFTSACSLREHMKTHIEKRQIVKCPLCDKGYQDERYMLRHLRTSHTRSQFSCPICHKLLTSAAGLRHHVITHSPLNTFRCKCCPKSYAVKRTIVKHLRKRHGLKGTEINIKDYFTRLEPRECKLNLDESTMNSIFGPPKKKMSDILIGDFVTFSKKLSFAQNAAGKESDDDSEDEEENHDTKDGVLTDKESENDEKPEVPVIKQEVPSAEEELEPTDFVSVKIEPLDDEHIE